MRKNIVNYYAFIMLGLFIVHNVILFNFKISGLLYQIFMFILITINMVILSLFRKNIKGKLFVIIGYCFVLIFSKGALQLIFGVSSMGTLIITGFMESNFIKIIAVIITVIVCKFALPLLFVFLLICGMGLNEERERYDIYEDMHYYCQDNYEIYTYSAGAMDSFHYSIGKHYEFIDFGDIISVTYNERCEVSQSEYENYLRKHSCSLVGEENESK